MRHVFASACALAVLAGCALLPGDGRPPPDAAEPSGSGELRPEMRPVARPTGGPQARPPEGARTAEEFDTVSAGEKQAAAEAAEVAAASGAGETLGQTVASLGDPAEPGLWIKTPLARGPGKGRVVYPVNGKAVEVELIPLDGPKTGGSRMSLAALRTLEAPLTELATVEVYAN